jgi:hypothetical protein
MLLKKIKIMKNIFKIVPLILFAISCKAQSPIININNRPNDDINGAYYKDVDNLLNQFEGTYISNFRGNKLEITLQKKEMNNNTVYYEDLLVGEFKYTDHGVVKVDRLNEMNVAYTDQRYHNIEASQIIEYGDYLCIGCTANEIRLSGGLVDTITHNFAEIIISRIIQNGQPAIKLWIGWQTKARIESAPYVPALIPGGDYIMIKQ